MTATYECLTRPHADGMGVNEQDTRTDFVIRYPSCTVCLCEDDLVEVVIQKEETFRSFLVCEKCVGSALKDAGFLYRG